VLFFCFGLTGNNGLFFDGGGEDCSTTGRVRVGFSGILRCIFTFDLRDFLHLEQKEAALPLTGVPQWAQFFIVHTPFSVDYFFVLLFTFLLSLFLHFFSFYFLRSLQILAALFCD